MDFRETGGVRRRLRALLSCLTRDVVVPAGGKFYLAKDNSLDSESFVRSMGEGTIERFLRLKSEVDPCTVLQSDMYRRLFAPYDSKGRPQA
jgi:decaprenylphospho-beta-D-ribofuranose 2-oxidase